MPLGNPRGYGNPVDPQQQNRVLEDLLRRLNISSGQGQIPQQMPQQLPPSIPPATVGDPSASLNLPISPPGVTPPVSGSQDQGGGFLQTLMKLIQDPSIQRLIGTGVAGSFGGNAREKRANLEQFSRVFEGGLAERRATEEQKFQRGRLSEADKRADEELGLRRQEGERGQQQLDIVKGREGRLAREDAKAEIETIASGNPDLTYEQFQQQYPDLSAKIGPPGKGLWASATKRAREERAKTARTELSESLQLQEASIDALSRRLLSNPDAPLPADYADAVQNKLLDASVVDTARARARELKEDKDLDNKIKQQQLTTYIAEQHKASFLTTARGGIERIGPDGGLTTVKGPDPTAFEEKKSILDGLKTQGVIDDAQYVEALTGITNTSPSDAALIIQFMAASTDKEGNVDANTWSKVAKLLRAVDKEDVAKRLEDQFKADTSATGGGDSGAIWKILRALVSPSSVLTGAIRNPATSSGVGQLSPQFEANASAIVSQGLNVDTVVSKAIQLEQITPQEGEALKARVIELQQGGR